jgi:peroxiredoxin
MLTIGSQAPAFSVVDSEKQPFNNETIAGKRTLILFFPAAFTGVCTKEMCMVRDEFAQYQQLNAHVVGVSTDTPFALAKFKEEQGYNFTLASDFNKTMCAAFGAQYDEFVLGLKGVARRAAFVIDTDGTIQYAEVLESAGDLPNFDAIKQTLEKLAVTA